jgi:hypothetical protein
MISQTEKCLIKKKKRKDKTRRSKPSSASANREKEPWLLATSLCRTSDTAKRSLKFLRRGCRERKALEMLKLA